MSTEIKLVEGYLAGGITILRLSPKLKFLKWPWLCGALMGGIALPLVWAGFYAVILTIFPSTVTEINRGQILTFNLTQVLIVYSTIQAVPGAVLGFLTGLVWQLQNRAVAIGTGVLGTTYFSSLLWRTFFEFSNNAIVVENAIDGVCALIPSLLWSLTLLMLGISKRKIGVARGDMK